MTCAKCNDTGEMPVPISEYIRQIDVQTGHADRPAFNLVFCGCKAGHAKKRKDADERFN